MADKLSQEELGEFSRALMAIIYSHRFKKGDDFLEGVEFGVVRDVLYSYTTEARERLIAKPFFSFLFRHFAVQHG